MRRFPIVLLDLKGWRQPALLIIGGLAPALQSVYFYSAALFADIPDKLPEKPAQHPDLGN